MKPSTDYQALRHLGRCHCRNPHEGDALLFLILGIMSMVVLGFTVYHVDTVAKCQARGGTLAHGALFPVCQEAKK